MLILPAIDLRGGKCVRLKQGDYAQETVFGDDPAAMARRWVGQGARSLHLVDLDGAKEGRPVNGESDSANRPGGRRPVSGRRRPAHGSGHRSRARNWRRPRRRSARGHCRTRPGFGRWLKPIQSISSSGWMPAMARSPRTVG